jgi:hypothetical protein
LNLLSNSISLVSTVTDLLKELLGNASVNTLQHAKMGFVFSVDKFYISLLGSTKISICSIEEDRVKNHGEWRQNWTIGSSFGGSAVQGD